MPNSGPEYEMQAMFGSKCSNSPLMSASQACIFFIKKLTKLHKWIPQDIRDFKIHYGGLLLRLLWPWGKRLTTPFPPQTSNRLRFRFTPTGCSASTCLYKNGYVRLYSTFIRQRLDQWQWFLLLCRSYISQNLDLLSDAFRTACNSNHKTK